MRQYDPAAHGALSRRQLAAVWSVGMLGGRYRELSDSEWAATREIADARNRCGQPYGSPPSLLQGVRKAGCDAEAGAAEDAAHDAKALTVKGLGAWLWSLVLWLTEPTWRSDEGTCRDFPSFRLDPKAIFASVENLPEEGLGHTLAKGLLRLWEAAAATQRPWTVARVAGRLAAGTASDEGAAVQRPARRIAPGAAGCLQVVRLSCFHGSGAHAAYLSALISTAAAPAPNSELGLWLSLRSGAAAQPASAFRAALHSCADSTPEESAEAMLLRECWAGRAGQWSGAALLLSGVGELTRKRRLDKLLRWLPLKGAAGVTDCTIEGLSLSAAQQGRRRGVCCPHAVPPQGGAPGAASKVRPPRRAEESRRRQLPPACPGCRGGGFAAPSL
eukprot:TRINITY_DN2281_c6_g1_i1.p1 TRINITY_DN2281_c6_g1~~TRINITY_DN2281_c6_g1_i1.p1  ORF type:complete len:454 (+),score=80.25 TRINITY_DN2281_c6_g1_i1:200-1363(+)